jgi:peptidoglycan/xylan/chitin deacetylase (PgdA/CDA1 family)
MEHAEKLSALIISLDFELHWGVRDHLSVEEYKENLVGARRAVPVILELFKKYQIHATWATVGFLFCKDREELQSVIPTELPSYRDKDFSPYAALDQIGADEKHDPFHYGWLLINQITATPNQEIGTHTLSHYFCLEPEQNIAAFRADLDAALRLGHANGCEIRSIVFPRNQYDAAHLEVCSALGITSFRGTERNIIYQGRSYKNETALRRLLRLLDSYLNLTGSNAFAAQTAGKICNLPSSRFLRPYSAALAPFERLRFRRIARAMEDAAKKEECFHLWWHPHNFGRDLNKNVDFLERVLIFFSELRARHGMQSLTMGEAAERITSKLQVATAR